MNVVAHEDDDILFMNPPTDTDVAAGRCLTTVYLTAGDDGQSAPYWQGREDGAMAAYATMAGTPNSWATAKLRTASGEAAVTRTLNGTGIRLIFLRLPTGSPTGRANHHYECLSKLHAGTIPRVHSVDGSAKYTSASLRATLTGFMTRFHPSVIRTLDYTDPYGDGDHADHHNAAYYTEEAQRDYTTSHRFQGFRGYPMTGLPANQSDVAAARKLAIFLAYAAHDPQVCQTAAACRDGRRYWSWMYRTYEVPAPASTVATVQRTGTDSSTQGRPEDSRPVAGEHLADRDLIWRTAVDDHSAELFQHSQSDSRREYADPAGPPIARVHKGVRYPTRHQQEAASAHAVPRFTDLNVQLALEQVPGFVDGVVHMEGWARDVWCRAVVDQRETSIGRVRHALDGHSVTANEEQPALARAQDRGHRNAPLGRGRIDAMGGAGSRCTGATSAEPWCLSRIPRSRARQPGRVPIEARRRGQIFRSPDVRVGEDYRAFLPSVSARPTL